MSINKIFKPASNDEPVSLQSDLNFRSEPKITGPIRRAMKKLLEQQKATELAISVLCDVSKTHCSMCKWEQECSDNPLLFDQAFARQFFIEQKSWLINKQSMCAKWQFQLGKHHQPSPSPLTIKWIIPPTTLTLMKMCLTATNATISKVI
jgi:hypothetical protein